MSVGEKQKITVLMDNPPLSGKKFFIVSMISPESRQKHQVYALKFHDVCETFQEAEHLAQYYNSLDNVFDCLIGSVGKWSPWLFNLDDVDAKYADEQLNNLVRSHRQKASVQDQQFINHVNKHKNEVAQISSKEFQAAIVTEKKESAVQVLFRIKQLELVLKRRNEEMEALQSIYNENYTDEERDHAKTLEDSFPLSEPSISQYKKLPEPNEEGEETERLAIEASPESEKVEPVSSVESYLQRTGKLSINEDKGKGPEVRKRTIEELKRDILARRS